MYTSEHVAFTQYIDITYDVKADGSARNRYWTFQSENIELMTQVHDMHVENMK